MPQIRVSDGAAAELNARRRREGRAVTVIVDRLLGVTEPVEFPQNPDADLAAELRDAVAAAGAQIAERLPKSGNLAVGNPVSKAQTDLAERLAKVDRATCDHARAKTTFNGTFRRCDPDKGGCGEVVSS